MSQITPQKMSGARYIAEAMQGYEVSHIFFVPAFIMKAFAEMEDMPIARIMVHGEKAAAYMADGYARASGKPGICMAQMIGASNLAAGLRDYYHERSGAGIDAYSAQALRRIWQAERFSGWMTTMLHQFPDMTAFERRLQQAEFDLLRENRAAAQVMAAMYIG